MPVLKIEGRRVTVDDSFLKLSPDDQQKTVDEIANSFGHSAEPVTTNDLGRSFASGVPIFGGLLNKADAATNAALAPVLNPLFAEKDQLSEPTFSERYAHSLADQNAMDERFQTSHPIVDAGAKLAGGAAAMVPAVAAAPGLFGATGGLGTQIFRGGLSNAVIGGADAVTRGNDFGPGAIVGGALGAAFPLAATVAKAAVGPIASNILARLDPERYGTGQVARAIVQSGRSTADIANDVAQAAREGQGQFTLGDALGNSGQRMMRAATGGPGEGRTAIVNDLEARQAGQGRRVSNALAEGFEAPRTAAQTRAEMEAARDTAADLEYGAVRDNASATNARVDVVPALNNLDRNIGTGPGQQLQAANDSIEGILRPFRERLARVNPDDFEAVERIRGDMADAAQNAQQSGYGNRARLIGQAVRHLDTELENASKGYRQANANFRQRSLDIGAIDEGRQAGMRGRPEDTIPNFQGQSQGGQRAFRTGYVDPLIESVQSAPIGANKARPLTNDAFQAEAAAMAPGNGLMQRRLSRENTMFETRNTALGGSKTDMNLADADALGIDPSVVGHILSGNYTGAARALIQAGANVKNGNTAAVRKVVADLLLQRGQTVTQAALDDMVSRTVQRMQAIQRGTDRAVRTASGASALATNAAQSRKKDRSK